MHRQSRQIDFIAAVKCRKSNLIKRFGRKAEKNLFPLTQRSSLINFTFCVISFRIHVNLSIERERAISLGCALHKFPGSLLSRICVIRSIHLPWSETVVVHSPLTESALSCWSPGEITHKNKQNRTAYNGEKRETTEDGGMQAANLAKRKVIDAMRNRNKKTTHRTLQTSETPGFPDSAFYMSTIHLQWLLHDSMSSWINNRRDDTEWLRTAAEAIKRHETNVSHDRFSFILWFASGRAQRELQVHPMVIN